MSCNIFDCGLNESRHPLDQLHKYTHSLSEDSEIEILGFKSRIAIEHIDILARKITKNWHYIQNVMLNDSTIVADDLINIREEINKCLKLIIECLKCCENSVLKERYLTSSWTEIRKITQLTLPISEWKNDIYVKLLSPSNKKECCVYQYFHTWLDLQFYLIIYDYISANNDELQGRVQTIIEDLIKLSVKVFKTKNNAVFVCSCHKNFWLIIQVLLETYLGLGASFWSVFNKTVDNFPSDFVLYLLKDVACLGDSKSSVGPNFPLLESSLKKFLSDVPLHSSIFPILKSLEALVCDLWLKSANIEVYQILWDHFRKRLNVSLRPKVNFTLNELVDVVDTVLWSGKDCQYDFELFLAMLGAHLSEHPYHWGKMKGRIFSQLGPNKVKDLDDKGIFNMLLLYLALTKVSFEELVKKFVVFVEILPVDKQQSQLVWSFYAAFVVRHVRENRDIELITSPFIKLSEEASTDQKHFHLLKTFINDFDNIITISTNLQLHQWLLINTWLHHYMTTCYYPDLITLLNILLKLIDRISNEVAWCDWESTFKNHVYPSLKYVAGSHTAPETCGTLAGKIVINCGYLQTEAFNFFNAESISPKVSASFLCVVLEEYPNFILSQAQEITVLQSWVKFCLLSRDNYETLTTNIIKLDVIPQFIKNAIIKTKDPLCAFIDFVGSNIKEYAQSVTMTKLCENFFGHVERPLAQFLTEPDNEAAVLRIYTCIALAFYKIGPLLYNKHKSSCPYARLFYALVLPTEIMLGKSLHALVLQSIKKTWHLFFVASVKLLTPNDAFLERILREMLIKYIPHFTISDSPILKALDNEINAEIILDKLSDAFFKQPTKEAESNVFKSLKLITEFVQSTTSEILLQLVVNKTLYGLFEVVMFHSQKNMAIAAIKSIILSPLYSRVQSKFEEIVVLLTEKHLAFNSSNYFQFMNHLAKLAPQTVKNVLPQVRQHLANVEKMRGIGYDQNFRMNLERLEASVLHKS